MQRLRYEADETGILLFRPLELEQLENIFDIQIGLLRERLNKQGVALEITPAARKLLAKLRSDAGYTPGKETP